ncbi:MAG: type III-B CRISPR module RAMP protein Cmr6 [Cyanobacteriota bacterium]|nr:type III-B CRISPR module RAMP protein Cmr6 [Cyanobacteriota bacterium]
MTYDRHQNQPPLAWLREERELNPHDRASFVEYLRWMRAPEPEIDSSDRIQQQISKENQAQNNITKAQALQKAVEKARHYKSYFDRRNQNTQLLAGDKENTFSVQCAWRMRVGGIRGPEDILLPAFDAGGMPYIPSSTLRGVARSRGLQALIEKITREIANDPTRERISEADSNGAKQPTRQQAIDRAKREIATYFGDLDAPQEDRAGKVIFFDAYPLAEAWGNSENGLAVDIANNIWSWNGDEPSYQPNPNLLLSLRKPTFLIGLRPMKHCDRDTFEKVKTWLIEGLQLGIGSQVNTGYGEMTVEKSESIAKSLAKPFLQVKFDLSGQLIHSYQKPNWKHHRGQYKFDPEAEAEVRPVAFKSMLRYWFRALARGVLPVQEIRDRLEPQLFGSIQPQTRGWVTCRIEELKPKPRTKKSQQTDRDALKQKGILKLSYSPQAPQSQYETISTIFTDLTWLMFHLGGVGQGARRPLYSRKDRPNGKPPWYRGCQLRAIDIEANDVEPNPETWQPSENTNEFAQQFRSRLQGFYQALSELTPVKFDMRSPLPVRGEVIGRFCQIVVCSGDAISGKPFALGRLHKQAHLGDGKYDRDLCGDANSNPSPIWIADLGTYQVVTVFDRDNSKRQKFLNGLQQNATTYEVLWGDRGLVEL